MISLSRSDFILFVRFMKKKVQPNESTLWCDFRKSGCLFKETFVCTKRQTYEGGLVRASSLCLRSSSSLSWVEAIVKESSGWTSMTTCESKTPLIVF